MDEELVSCIVHFRRIDYDLMKRYKDSLNVYAAYEPPCADYSHSESRLCKMGDYFDYILTWNDNLVDQKTFIKFDYTVDFTISKIRTDFEDRKLITNISYNKRSNHPDELYSERYKAIQYFDKMEPTFEFYGGGWEDEGFKGYKGFTLSKRSTLSNYKFSLCFENQERVKGYISEKIWECLLCGTVPIYWGADNIAEFIPEECFIDFRNYLNLEDLHNKLITMPREEWQEYIENIEIFVKNSTEGSFSAKYFAKILMDILQKGKKTKKTKFKIWKIYRMRFIKIISRAEKAYEDDGIINSYLKYLKYKKKGLTLSDI